jgi:hypothetical protein
MSASGSLGLCCFVGFGFEGLSSVWICGCSYCIIWVSSIPLEPLVYTVCVFRSVLRFLINT